MTKIIFDSRIATRVYEGIQYPYYRSADFEVKPGEVAILEVTASCDNISKVCFAAYRGIGEPFCESLDNTGLGKLYRRWGCQRRLGSPCEGQEGGGTQYTEYNRSVLRLGNDMFNNTIVEFEYIDRPGRYYLLADKGCCEETAITDCDSPTLVEVTIAPMVYNKTNPCVDYMADPTG